MAGGFRLVKEGSASEVNGSKNYRDLVYVDRIEILDSRINGDGESMPDESAREHNASSEDTPF